LEIERLYRKRQNNTSTINALHTVFAAIKDLVVRISEDLEGNGYRQL